MIVVTSDPEHHRSKLCKARRKIGFICDVMANSKMASSTRSRRRLLAETLTKSFFRLEGLRVRRRSRTSIWLWPSGPPHGSAIPEGSHQPAARPLTGGAGPAARLKSRYRRATGSGPMPPQGAKMKLSSDIHAQMHQSKRGPFLSLSARRRDQKGLHLREVQSW
jgi:hypothetical protein